MRIAIDAMGGDFAPKAVVQGTIDALNETDKDTTLFLIGKEQEIKKYLTTSSERLHIVNAEEVIEMGEHPTRALQQKQNSSIAIGFGMLQAGKAQAFCSAGNTGAMMVGSMFSVKTISGISRPAIVGFVPKESGNFGVVLDIGANADCKPEHLSQFATMGSLYAQYVLGISNPKIGLLNIGEEEQKGSILTQAVHQLLKSNTSLNFIGNIEGRDLFNDRADVIVSDGFTGNVVLKLAESFYDLLEKRKIHDPFLDRFNYEEYGGSPILGVNGNVIIAHGVSTPKAIKNMILQAEKMIRSEVTEQIKKALTAQTTSN